MNTRLILITLTGAMILGGLFSCSSDTDVTNDQNEVIDGGKVVAPTVTWPLTNQQASDMQPLNDFTLRLTRQLWHDGDSSIVVSPLSLAIALSMVNEGAVGETRDEITEALGFPVGKHELLTDLCASLLAGMTLSSDSLTLEMANACFVNLRMGLYSEYRDIMTKYYQAEVSAMDFSKPSAVADRCNQWCYDKTHGHLHWIVNAGDINDETVALWLNAIYYKGLWAAPFDKKHTADEIFHTLDGQRYGNTRIPMMHQTNTFNYVRTDEFAALELPACNKRFTMTVVLPHSMDGLGSLLGHMDAQRVSDLGSQMQPKNVDLSLPRFITRTSLDDELTSALKAFGMHRAFSVGEAQITNVSPATGLFISLIRQNALIDVTEEGAEAAAVTAIGGIATESGVCTTFNANRPFLYFITDHETGLIVFIGIYNG